MVPRIFLVNPAVYDFTAYDFWLKPYGILTVAGCIRGKAEFLFFDYLDRLHPFVAGQKKLDSNNWGCGRFYEEKITTPDCFKHIPRHYRRFGLPRELFQQYLADNQPCDFAMIQTTMTYWYPGVKEAIEDIRRYWPKTKIILGGNYVTLCPKHSAKLGADFQVEGINLERLWEYLDIKPNYNEPAFWEAYEKLKVGILKISDGCPFRCSYCSVPKVYKGFSLRLLEKALAELNLLLKLGADNIAFYDDALLFRTEEVLEPFLEHIIREKIKINLHTPNALNARFLTAGLADLMVEAGFKTFHLGFESLSSQWHEKTGSKVLSEELATAVANLRQAGAETTDITAYQILGHPHGDIQQLEDTMRFVNGLGIGGMLADFSPIPGTPDGEQCSKWVDMDEPLMHNKTAFPIILLGFNESNRLKHFQQQLNRNLL